MAHSSIDAAMAEGWEVRVCSRGHLLVTKPELPYRDCGHQMQLHDLKVPCERSMWWLLDDPVVDATYRTGGVDAAVIVWVDSHGHWH